MPLITQYATKAEWLGARRGLLTSTRVPKIIGVCPYGGPLDAKASIIGVRREPGKAAQRRMLLGNRLESAILDVGREWFPDIRHANHCNNAIHRLAMPDGGVDLAFSPDAIIDDEFEARPLQIKLQSSRSIWENGVPLSYRIQSMVESYVQGVDVGYVLALIASTDLRLYEVPLDRPLMDDILTYCRKWWQSYILDDGLPPQDPSDDIADLLSRLLPASEHEGLTLNDEDSALVIGYHEAHAAHEATKKAKQVAGNELRRRMGHAVYARAGAYHVSWKPTKSGSRPLRVLKRAPRDAKWKT